MSADDRGDWCRTRSGGRFYPADPRPEDFSIHDIASGLSKMCRFSGQIEKFYSVAEHSVLVATILPPELRLQGLLHDATEAYLGDITRPVKRLLPEYQALEDRVWRAIAARFGVPEEMAPEVKAADNDVLLAEKSVLFARDPGWTVPGKPADVPIFCFDHADAEDLFIRCFNNLTKEIP